MSSQRIDEIQVRIDNILKPVDDRAEMRNLLSEANVIISTLRSDVKRSKEVHKNDFHILSRRNSKLADAFQELAGENIALKKTIESYKVEKIDLQNEAIEQCAIIAWSTGMSNGSAYTDPKELGSKIAAAIRNQKVKS